MQYKKLTFQGAGGLNAANAQALVKLTTPFASHVHIEKGNKKINAKSIMGVLSLGVKQGESVLVFVDGADEDSAMLDLEGFFAS